MNMYEGYHFWGMHLFWWFLWVVFLFWVFATPYRIPGQRRKSESPIDVLDHRLASGTITNEEYIEKKKHLTSK